MSQLEFDCQTQRTQKMVGEDALDRWLKDETSWDIPGGSVIKIEQQTPALVTATESAIQAPPAKEPAAGQPGARAMLKTPDAAELELLIAAADKKPVQETKSAVPAQEKQDPQETRIIFAEQAVVQAGYAMFAPRLKGPWTDSKDETVITSSKSWKRSVKESCTEVKSDKVLRDKAQALKEIFYRFTGSDDFHDAVRTSMCGAPCKNESGREMLVTGFAVEDGAGGSFEIKENGNSCSYALTRPIEGWKMLRTRKVVCSCLQ